MGLGGLLWFLVVFGDSWCFLVVFGGSRCFVVVHYGSWLFLVVLLGFRSVASSMVSHSVSL